MKRILLIISIICIVALSGCINKTTKTITTIPPLNEKEYELTIDETDFNLINFDGYNSKKINYTAFINGEDSKNDVTWTSSNDSVATVDDGVVYAHSRGAVCVEAKLGDKIQKININVLDKIDDFDIFNNDNLNWYGRNYKENNKTMVFENTASGFEVNFIGTSLSCVMDIRTNDKIGLLKRYVDGKEDGIIVLSEGNETPIDLVSNLENGFHTVKILKMTELSMMGCKLHSLTTDGTFITPFEKPKLKFEFYGDSITCGYGVFDPSLSYPNDEDGTNTYATMLGEKYNAEVSITSYSGICASLYVNSQTFNTLDIYKQTTINNTDPWDFSSYQADLVIINLGTNDSNSINVGNTGTFQTGYSDLVRGLSEVHPNATILCIYGMMGINSIINVCEEEAVTNLQNEGYPVYFVNISANDYGTYGHPDLDGHKMAVEQISSYLDIICDFNR